MKRPYVAALQFTGLLLVFITALGYSQYAAAETVGCSSKDAYCFTPQLTKTVERLDAVTMPKIATPIWLTQQGVQSQAAASREVTYVAARKGNVTADFDEFLSQVNQTLNSPQGWSRLGVRFVRVESGGQFTIWLSEATHVPSFSPSGCDAVVSCRVGDDVIINETRWVNGADAWNAAGGSLRDYRHMVVNHETGHWLGHGHEYCGGSGQMAPVMQQQTLDMQGCNPNPWPQGHELYSPQLGIRS